MLKPKINKLEARSEVCDLVDYLKRIIGHYFYSQVAQKIFVNTNIRFPKEYHMISNKKNII